jgi:hypothetical protein
VLRHVAICRATGATQMGLVLICRNIARQGNLPLPWKTYVGATLEEACMKKGRIFFSWSPPYFVKWRDVLYVDCWKIVPLKKITLSRVEISCGNNGQGGWVDNLYSRRVKSILTGHKQKHLHLYQINGRSRLGSNSGSDPSTNKNINNFMWNRKLSEVQKWRENERNNEHDKIGQYFPQSQFFTRCSFPKNICKTCANICTC